MSHISTEKLRVEIEEILKDADLSKTSAKKVRLQLEKKLEVALSARRKEIDQLVMDYVNSRESDHQSDDDDEASEEETVKKQPKKEVPKRKRKSSDDEDEQERKPKKSPAKKRGRKKKKTSDDDRSDSDSDADFKPPTKEKKKGGGGGGNGYTRALRLSPALAELMGQDEMPRHEVVKRVWAIIKERNLYDANNKQFAICDDALYKVFGCKRFRTFGMMKYLKTHFYG